MKKLLFLLLPLSGFSQKVYVVHDKKEADLLVYRAKYFIQADLVVKRTYDITEAREKRFHWYFVDSKQAADQGWVIYYTDDPQESDTCVYLTNRVGLLGSYTPGEPIKIKK